MKREPQPAIPEDNNAEINALIAVLHQTEQRLEQLTAGEVDTVTDREGRTLLLRRAQEYLRHSEAAKQAAILNALPGNIALLDAQGIIISVNAAWERFASSNSFQSTGQDIGLNYLDICDAASGRGSSEASQVATGIRSILSGGTTSFSFEYACHSPTEQRWFLLMVTPLSKDHPNGVVVMHLDISGERQTEEKLRVSESGFRQMADHISDVFFLQNLDGSEIYYVSPAYDQIWGRPRENLYVNPQSWANAIHPEDLTLAIAQSNAGSPGSGFDYEFRILQPNGEIRWIHSRGFPVQDAAGNTYRIAGVCKDITQRKQAMQALLESERRFSDILENVQLASVMLDREARITYCNEYLLQLTDWQHEDVIGKNWFEVFMPPELERMKSAFEAQLANLPEAWHGEHEIFTRSGQRRLIRWNNLMLRSAFGEVTGVASIGEDITERKKAEHRIAYLNRVYAMLSGINALIVRVRSREELFKEACRIAVATGGFRMALIGMIEKNVAHMTPAAWAGGDENVLSAIKSLISSSDDGQSTMITQALKEQRSVVSNDPSSDFQLLFAKQNAEIAIRSIAVLPLIVSGVALGVLVLYAGEYEFFHEGELKLVTELAGDIAFAIDHIGKQDRLEYLAYYDVLTGLANRSLFLERLSRSLDNAVSDNGKVAMYLIDIERFRNINDSLGRATGDALLEKISKWLARNSGNVNTLARVGADQFAILLPSVANSDDVLGGIEKTMADLLDHPFELNGAMFRISAKVGAAVFPDDGDNADTLLRNAEVALKKAKTSGNRYLFYSREMNAHIAEKLTLENQLREALDNKEFVLHYQPKVDLASCKITSVEALLRWNNPRTGLVPPDQFIPILEETGLIHDVGRWALRKAVEDYMRWRGEGLAAVRIAVNVSPLQLRHRGFVEEIALAISVDPEAAAGLELEITESLIMEDLDHSIASLTAIRAMGVTIAIDDFGTGFSSLSYLSRLPVDTLKIDGSFIKDMTGGPEKLALVSTIINLAHAVKLKVVAEGVETLVESGLLRLLGCDEMQGYLYSRAVPVDILETKFLRTP